MFYFNNPRRCLLLTKRGERSKWRARCTQCQDKSERWKCSQKQKSLLAAKSFHSLKPKYLCSNKFWKQKYCVLITSHQILTYFPCFSEDADIFNCENIPPASPLANYNSKVIKTKLNSIWKNNTPGCCPLFWPTFVLSSWDSVPAST